MLAYFALCCSAKIEGDKRIGDPTELALLDVNNAYGLDISGIQELKELPFDSDRKLMTVLVKYKNEKITYIMLMAIPINKKEKLYNKFI